MPLGNFCMFFPHQHHPMTQLPTKFASETETQPPTAPICLTSHNQNRDLRLQRSDRVWFWTKTEQHLGRARCSCHSGGISPLKKCKISRNAIRVAEQDSLSTTYIHRGTNYSHLCAKNSTKEDKQINKSSLAHLLIDRSDGDIYQSS